MDLHLKLQGGELEIILEALLIAAKKHADDQQKNFFSMLDGADKLYLDAQEKRMLTWEAYHHIRRAAGLDNPWEDEDE